MGKKKKRLMREKRLAALKESSVSTAPEKEVVKDISVEVQTAEPVKKPVKREKPKRVDPTEKKPEKKAPKKTNKKAAPHKGFKKTPVKRSSKKDQE